ncbi:flagellar assembly peptidoglycan hydrolase FlgJ [Pantoea sp. B270]|uniref:flagellar assembly peptidoglycan hydrolase FlgJ n=1 Tax=Pantoea sp. B270 TaxID=2836826 RepID=UPI001BFFA40A|nr:flagellar assembly peptidoglycan hydrolase FlgJ [Pantoea sp. B270]MBU6517711.1 flagellar assembly peptidoglycan hydrolase FlgJ [Pantoea sp. B270]
MTAPQGYAAYDVQGLSALKRQMRADGRGAMQSAAREMEGLFVQVMLKSMRQACFGGGLLQSQAGEMMTSLYDQQLALQVAGRGELGLAQMMLKQMGELPQTVNQTAGTRVPEVMQRLSHSLAPQPAQPAVTLLPALVAPLNSAPGGDRHDFIRQLMQPALAVAQRTGIDHHLIIAQAALESGWGRGEIRTASGERSYNLFGIKASPDWQGKTTDITTTEFIDGVATKTRAAFRVYDSFSEALSDYARFIADNPRYRAVTDAASGEQAAQALQHSGYATDPHYASKLISIMQRVKSTVSASVSAYQTDLSTLF